MTCWFSRMLTKKMLKVINSSTIYVKMTEAMKAGNYPRQPPTENDMHTREVIFSAGIGDRLHVMFC